MSEPPPPPPPPAGLAQRVVDASGNVAIKAGLWVLSVGILDFLVGSPVTDLYIGFSIVGVAFYLGWRASIHFDEPPVAGSVTLTDGDERRYRGEVEEDGSVRFTGPDGGVWTGTSWSGRWTVDDPGGRTWRGRVGSRGRVVLEDGEGRELRGTLEAD